MNERGWWGICTGSYRRSLLCQWFGRVQHSLEVIDPSRWQEAYQKWAGVHSVLAPVSPEQVPVGSLEAQACILCPVESPPQSGQLCPPDLSLRRTRMALRARKLLNTLKIRKTLWW